MLRKALLCKNKYQSGAKWKILLAWIYFLTKSVYRIFTARLESFEFTLIQPKGNMVMIIFRRLPTKSEELRNIRFVKQKENTRKVAVIRQAINNRPLSGYLYSC